jgi:RND family efflux transporter MFP subunit
MDLKEIFTNRKRIIILAVIVVVGGIFVWRLTAGGKKESTQVQTARVEKGTIVSSISASGNVVSSNIENVTTQASGTVSKVYVKDGDEVVAGQKLAEIDLDVQGQQNYASSYSSYISAVNSLKSAENSYRSSQASLAVVYDEIKGHDDDETLEMKEKRTKAEVANDNAYDGIQSAKARLSSASLDYRTSSPVITAPVAGTVRSVTVAEGMNIGAEETSSGSRANQRVATIATEGLPIITFNISEIDVPDIAVGQKATVTLDAIADKTFTGKVVSVDRVGTTTNNVTTYPGIIQLDTSSDQILPNMAVSINIIVNSKSNVLVVPLSAVSLRDGTSTVTVVENDQQIIKTVETGISNDTQTEIISGLSEGDIIVTGTISSTSQEGSSPFGGGMPGMIRMSR